MRRMIPNLCTSANLFFGMCSILATFHGDYFFGSVFILIALVADGLDGRIARALNVVSELGKEMDSLCDLGSFGIAPAFLAYSFCMHHFGYYGSFAAILFALCGMWRLARFNVNTSVVHGYFMGLAIPAGGCIVASTTPAKLRLGLSRDDDRRRVFNGKSCALPGLQRRRRKIISGCKNLRGCDVRGNRLLRAHRARAGVFDCRLFDIRRLWHHQLALRADEPARGVSR